MNYQDQKLRAIGRLTIITVVGTVLSVVSLLFPEQTVRMVTKLLALKNDARYSILVGILWIFTSVMWGIIVGLFFTSPEQEVGFVRWSKRWQKNFIPFEAIEFDVNDPDYKKPAWRYLMERSRGQHP